ncbi:hypothetical protein [Nannocystis pusilla]|uniref:hypothetical protein n=1 Tax=Nannocystis pusilla TaxID=889268 RepID=UPI003B7F3F50
MVAGEVARLQLVGPIQACGEGQAQITLQMPLESALVELRVVEGAEVRGQPAEGSDEPELSHDAVDDEAEPGLAHELEASLGFSLDVAEGLAGEEKIGERGHADIGRKGEIAGFLRGVEGASYPLEAGPHVAGPRVDGVPEA